MSPAPASFHGRRHGVLEINHGFLMLTGCQPGLPTLFVIALNHPGLRQRLAKNAKSSRSAETLCAFYFFRCSLFVLHAFKSKAWQGKNPRTDMQSMCIITHT